MNESEIMVVNDYLLDLTTPIFSCATKSFYDYFRRRCYSRWAGNEILELLKKNPHNNAIDIITKFKNDMCNFKKLKKKTCLMFQTAENVADDLLDILRDTY